MSSYVETKFRNLINNEGSDVPVDDLKGKIVGLYFSAHWCGPCRSFTPQLVEKYLAIKSAGYAFEIIFVSSDEDEESAMDYFKTMPWLMIKFEDRSLDEQLSKEYDISGIPTLVLLDEDGSLLTADGRSLLMSTQFGELKAKVTEKRLAEQRFNDQLLVLKSNPFKPSAFFNDRSIVDKDGNSISATALEGKIIGLYFSAHWCGPCRSFTPMLKSKYEALVSEGKPFEIVFISSDRDEHSAKEYFSSEMPWKMLSFEDREGKSMLSTLFEIRGIPSLVLVDDDGLITLDGCEAVMDTTFDNLKSFEVEKKRQLEILEKKIEGMPSKVLIAAHPHPLVKTPSVYRGNYGCDVCGRSGEGWVYHCDECGFDCHPACACPECFAE